MDTELTELSLPAQKLVGDVRKQYYFMQSHIDALHRYLNDNAMLSAHVFILPRPTQSDYKNEKVEYHPEHVTGREAVDRALHHFVDDKLKHDQAGVMANRLPGVLFADNVDAEEVVARVERINLEKDNLLKLIKQASSSMTEQFLLTKAAIPYAIRKSMGRHIQAFRAGELISVSFSVSKRSSVSATKERDYWLQRLENAERHVMSRRDLDNLAWQSQLEIERRALSHLSPDTLLRQERPIRRTPVANLYYHKGRGKKGNQKASQIAHSPILILNDREVKVNPMRPYSVPAKDPSTKTPIVPRWHLYEVERPRS